MTGEQKALLQKARRNLRGARLMADGELWDLAISRAYYVMFNVVRALLLGEGLRYSKHSAVLGAFGQHFAKTGRVPVEFHRRLLDAQEDREKADYGTADSPTEQTAAELISHAEDFLALAEQMLGPIPDADEETR